METAKILVVDDDSAVRTLLTRFLSRQGYQVESAIDGSSALAQFERFSPDLLILDVNLPDTNGYQLCEIVQKRTGVYVILLTSRDDETDILTGFAKGADDYITKPFSLMSVGARIAAILRRQRHVEAASQPALSYEQLQIDPARREVWFAGQPITLTALEFDLLHFLATHPDRVWRRNELIQEVWEYDYVGDQRVVDVHIGQIRKKLEINPNLTCPIQTVRGVGYKFESAAMSLASRP
ncbi:response regulator transcription factor [Synechococcus elongatus]|uniref:Response regulator transcription factor n=1 Tax=Synechococcus elongatus PCC 11802 TaxID=2283154 RepID=A0AAU6R4U5_SYNEL|nr:response regulator transcription factor [Synechococcus elongatus]QFZ90999.1 response regulator transcription factor [Synechococcus elongatus PCC 11802]